MTGTKKMCIERALGCLITRHRIEEGSHHRETEKLTCGIAVKKKNSREMEILSGVAVK